MAAIAEKMVARQEAYIADAMAGVDTNPDITLVDTNGDSIGDDWSSLSSPGIEYAAPTRFIYEALLRPFAEDPTTIVEMKWESGTLKIENGNQLVRSAGTKTCTIMRARSPSSANTSVRPIAPRFHEVVRATTPPQIDAGPRTLDFKLTAVCGETSRELVRGGQNEVLIEHRGDCYRLRLTRQGKLILNK